VDEVAGRAEGEEEAQLKSSWTRQIDSMSLFTSDRERWLWLWTLAVLLALYATLGPARVLVDALREQNLLRVSFGLLLFLVVAAVARQWVRKRPGWSEVGVALGVALAYAGTFLRMGSPEERTHLIEYGIVAVLLVALLLISALVWFRKRRK